MSKRNHARRSYRKTTSEKHNVAIIKYTYAYETFRVFVMYLLLSQTLQRLRSKRELK